MPSRWVEKRAHMEATPSTEFAVGRVHIVFLWSGQCASVVPVALTQADVECSFPLRLSHRILSLNQTAVFVKVKSHLHFSLNTSSP